MRLEIALKLARSGLCPRAMLGFCETPCEDPDGCEELIKLVDE